MIHIFLSFSIEYLEITLEGKLDPRGIVATYFVLSFVELLPLLLKYLGDHNTYYLV